MKQLLIFPLLVLLSWSTQAQRLNVESEDFYISRLKRTTGGGASLIFENANADTVSLGVDILGNYFVNSPRKSVLNSQDDIFFQINDVSRLYITQQGNVGIGTNTPADKLHVENGRIFIKNSTTRLATFQSSEPNAFISIRPNDGIQQANIGYFHDNSDQYFFLDTPSAGFGEFIVRNNGNVGIGTTNPQGPLHILRTGLPPSSLPSDQNGLLLGNQANTGYKWIQSYGGDLVLNSEGNDVAIGTTTVPLGYRLAVDGNIIAERVRVRLSQNWPDYVFEADYDLMPLEELKQSIQQNGHLPNIPAAQVMEEEGQDLGEMQVKMMEKIEELTLYILEMNDHISELNNKIKVLEEAHKK